MESSEFAGALRRRVREAKQALGAARAEEDFYAVNIRTGELDSLLRLAMENGVDLGEEHEVADRAGNR